MSTENNLYRILGHGILDPLTGQPRPGFEDLMKKRYENLHEPFNGQFWIGQQDAVTIEEIVLEPGIKPARVFCQINKNCLPPLDWLGFGNIPFLQTALRSRVAQSGIDVFEDTMAAEHLLEQFCPDFKNELQTGTIPLIFPAINLSGRRIVIPKDFGLFRFYYPQAAEGVHGNNLMKLIENKDLTIEGKQGQDWNFINSQRLEKIAINLTIDPESWTWFSPDPDNLFTIPQRSNYREELAHVLTPLSEKQPDPDKEILWICESKAQIHLPNRKINALVAKWIETEHERTLHSNAQLVAGGQTDWRIRFEIMCKEGNRPKSARLDFYKNTT